MSGFEIPTNTTPTPVHDGNQRYRDNELPNTVPAPVRARLQACRDSASDSHAALLRISDSKREASAAKEDAEARLEQLKRDERFMPDDHPALVQANNDIARHQATLERLNARVDALEITWGNAARLVDGLEKYVIRNVAQIALHKDPAPQLLKGETAASALERAARRTRTLQADRRDILASPFPSSEAKKAARQQIAERVAAAKPNFELLIERLEPIEFPLSRAATDQHRYAPTDPASSTAIDPVGLMAWMNPAAFLEAVDREIDACADDKAALSTTQRIEKLAQIDSDLLASEREEAAFAELAGVLPRPDLDPRAVLGLAASMPPPPKRNG